MESENDEKFDKAVENLLGSKILGLDTEFSGGFTKFDEQNVDICLI